MNDRQRLEAIVGVVCRHLPPDGIPVSEAMSQIIALVDPLPAPVQEPVAWMYPDDYERMLTSETFCTVYSVEVGSATRGKSTVPLYTTQPAQPAVPDAMTSADIQEHIEYVAGWNECRQTMLEILKARGNT
jgi:hypothetical protein